MIYTIYKLCCDDTDKFYVGSTKNRKERVRRHREASKVETSKVYQTIREFGGWENWRMVNIEEYECDGKREAEKREEYWRLNLKADLNSQRCYMTLEDKIQYEKERYAFFENHTYVKGPLPFECKCGSICANWNKSRHLKTKKHIDWVKSQTTPNNNPL